MMYNLNVNLSAAAASAVNNLLAVESACTTPRTPEILNSLIAMTNPLDNYSFGGDDKATMAISSLATTSTPSSSSAAAASRGPQQPLNHDSNSSSCQSQTESSPMTPPSVQHTCSQLIKAGLKLSIESKRKCSLENDDLLLDLDTASNGATSSGGGGGGGRKRMKRYEGSEEDSDRVSVNEHGLTPEDEERRRRRRERNKIAATKCRLKKREKTVILVQESEVLETQNVDLKNKIQDLENQRRRLTDMLTMHSTSCIMKTSQHHQQQQQQNQSNQEPHFSARSHRHYGEDDNGGGGPLPPVSSLPTAVIETNHTYNGGRGQHQSHHQQSMDVYHRPEYARTTVQYPKPPPTIVVEEPQEDTYTLSNLDNLNRSSAYNTFNSQQCHNYTGGSSQNYGNSGLDNGCMA